MFNYNCDVYFVTCARDGSVHICGGLQKKNYLKFHVQDNQKDKNHTKSSRCYNTHPDQDDTSSAHAIETGSQN